MKEVLEETGIECEVVRLIAVLDGLRLGFTRVPLYSLVFHCRAIGGELQRPPARDRRRRLVRRGRAAVARSPGSTGGRPAAFAAIDGEQVEVQFDTPRTRPLARATESAVSPRAGRAARRRSTRCRRLVSHASPMRSWSTRPAASGAMPSASVTAAGERRGLDLVAVGGERLEPVPELIERRRRRVAVGERERGRPRTGRGCRHRRSLGSGDRMEPPLEGQRRRARRRGSRPVSRSRTRRPARRSGRRAPRSARASPAIRSSARAPRQSPCWSRKYRSSSSTRSSTLSSAVRSSSSSSSSPKGWPLSTMSSSRRT